MSTDLATWLQPYALSSQALTQLTQLLIEFQNINAITNLSSFNDPDNIAIKHFYDSLALLAHPDLLTGARALDMGTGGGFPGLPMAICTPHLAWTLVDATRKKVTAVQTLAEHLHLPNVHPVWGRLETLAAQPAYHQRFDLITARALSDLPALWQYAAPFLRPGGHLVTYKTDPTEAAQTSELAARHGFKLVAIHPYSLPNQAGHRALFVYAVNRLTVHSKSPSRKV